MGAVIFAVMGLYLLISIGVVKAAIAHARKNGKRAWLWGLSAALVMYLIPFWDWIPTVVMHRYYCATEAGFWVYKMPEQWVIENPGVLDSLLKKDAMDRTVLPDGAQRLAFNQRLALDTFTHKFSPLATYEDIETFRDLLSGEVLAKRVSIWSGYGNLAVGGQDWRASKFWLSLDPCVPDIDRYQRYFIQLEGYGARK